MCGREHFRVHIMMQKLQNMLGEDKNKNNITKNLNAKITNENAKVAKYVGRELFRSRQPAG